MQNNTHLTHDEIVSLLEENALLKKQIQELEKKIHFIKVWLQREVAEQTRKIAQKKIHTLTQESKEVFLAENIEEIIARNIHNFFGDILLLNAPKGTIEGITTAEINFYSFLQKPFIDGFSVVSAYHKVLDLLIESGIINNFRKFARKKGQVLLRVNDPIEKSFHLIVNNRYSLSVGRLFGVIKLIKKQEMLYDYGRCFQEYLEKYEDIKNTLLCDDFFYKLAYINDSGILSKKRHRGMIDKKETIEARKVFIGDFKDKKAIIYRLLEMQSVIY